jgi:hypothetical protein
MGQSYRIKTDIGVNKTINVDLEQDFEFLEILSLKIQQADVYTRNCADYGVVVGRVTANNGFGLPNARVSIFIPIEVVDESNPIISSIYPYKSPSDKNSDGYRYNLLPYEKSYSTHAATGTLPSRLDALTGSTPVEIYDKYYKFTAKTNESGDFMIMGAPLGSQTIVMDVDLSDIGEFSLTPQDLIRMGKATEAQVAGANFRTSSDLNSLPQIVTATKIIEVSPLWGDPTICQIAVNRIDFDLRDDFNINIEPTATFMGSIVSTTDKYRVKKNAKPKDDMGNMCGLIAGPGQILAIRQTINQDSNGNPILEQYQIEQSGNIIDDSGSWLTELPMNLDYVVTNEFGEKVLSNDPSIGIPTKAKYRFKVKWAQSTSVNEQTKRPYYLVPNVREYGWSALDSDPYTDTNIDPVTLRNKQRLRSSYYFGLDWTGYTEGFSANTTPSDISVLNSKINCEDTFYLFEFNRVYTVASLISEFKKGAKGRFIGIKEIDSSDCETTTNKFPTNDGFRNFDFLYFLFAILMQIFQIIGIPLLIIYHFLAFIWNNFAVIIVAYFIVNFGLNAAYYWSLFYGAIAGSAALGATAGMIAGFLGLALLYTAGVVFLTIKFKDIVKYKFGRIKLPMITYPDCQACDCESETTAPDTAANNESAPSTSQFVTQLSNSGLYYDSLLTLSQQTTTVAPDNADYDNYTSLEAICWSQAMAGNGSKIKDPTIYKINNSDKYDFPAGGGKRFSIGLGLPVGERVNVFNTRKKYFDGINKIKVTFAADSNNAFHYDNTLSILSQLNLEPGTLLTFISPTTSKDKNFLWTGTTAAGSVQGITGITNAMTSVNVSYATSQTSDATTAYILPAIENQSLRYQFPSDVEYYQVLTAITINTQIVNGKTVYSLPQEGPNDSIWKAINSVSNVVTFQGGAFYDEINRKELPTSDILDYGNQKVLILQRGVDPYSAKYVNKFGIGKILGFTNEDDVTFTASTRLNVPIQKLPQSTTISVQSHSNQNNIFYPSYSFNPGVPGSSTSGEVFSGFTTPLVGYYGALDKNISTIESIGETWISTSYVKSPSGFPIVTSKTLNRYYNQYTSESFYDGSEDLSGGAIMFGTIETPVTIPNFNPLNPYPDTIKAVIDVPSVYFSPILYPSFTGTSELSISNSSKIVMRTDRLPSSDALDDSLNYNGSVSLLQQNNAFSVYIINDNGSSYTSLGLNTGADTVTADIEGQIAEQNVLDSLNYCQNMVGLSCYSGYSGTFGVSDGCQLKDSIENGCYVLMTNPLFGLGKDISAFEEWGYRFRFFYALCRGVLAQSFVNNWVNGTLYTFPIQVDTKYDNKNKPLPPDFAKKLIYFNDQSNNFYYRSSPYYIASQYKNQPFLGAPPSGDRPLNTRELMFPTTIINLGIKSSFYQEIIFDPSARAYIMDTLSPTSFSDTSDLVNLFVISRIANSSVLQELISFGNNGLDKLFSRPQRRVDGDLAQTMSINSEYGVVPFSPEFYDSNGSNNSPVSVYGGQKNPTIGIFFSSTTQNLQDKDFISPGVIDFRPSIEPYTYSAITYQYGIFSQQVPFYRWGYNLNLTKSIFGDEQNSWKTSATQIMSANYQSLSRRTPANQYFVGSNVNLGDIYERGYIFNVSGTTTGQGKYAANWQPPYNYFLVGAPFHFYFGLVKGNSAFDKFKTKYSVNG